MNEISKLEELKSYYIYQLENEDMQLMRNILKTKIDTVNECIKALQ